MKFILVSLALGFSLQSGAQTYNNYNYPQPTQVTGYQKTNGTYVQPYYRTHADYTQKNNYSTQGNINPYTGKAGTKKANY